MDPRRLRAHHGQPWAISSACDRESATPRVLSDERDPMAYQSPHGSPEDLAPHFQSRIKPVGTPPSARAAAKHRGIRGVSLPSNAPESGLAQVRRQRDLLDPWDDAGPDEQQLTRGVVD